MTFCEKLKSGKFVITVEVAPPRGTNYRELLHSLSPLKGKVDAFNVTDCQRSMVRMSSLAMAKLLLDSGYEPVLQFTCRDRNRIALQSELLGAYALGIRNLCLMTGDFTSLGDQPDSKPVFDLDSLGLIALARRLMEGKLLNGKPLDGSPSFCIGGVFNPFAGPESLQVLKLKRKVELGAEFIQTQPIYELDRALEVCQLISSLGAVPLIGLLPIKSLKMANFIKRLNPTSVPDSLVRGLERAKEPALYGWEYVLDLARALSESCRGVHFMLVGRVKELSAFIDELREREKGRNGN